MRWVEKLIYSRKQGRLNTGMHQQEA